MHLNICSNPSVGASVMDMTLGAESEGRRFKSHLGIFYCNLFPTKANVA